MIEPAKYIIRTTDYRDNRGLTVNEHEVIAGEAPEDFPRFTVTLRNVPIARDIHGNQAHAPGPFIVPIDAVTIEEAFLVAPESVDKAIAVIRKKGGEEMFQQAVSAATPDQVASLAKQRFNGS